MKSPSGAVGQIDLSRHANYGYEQRVEVFGAGGVISSDNVRTLSSQLFNTRGCSQPPLKHSFPKRYADGYNLKMGHFIDAIKNVENVLVSKDDVLRSWCIVDAIERSFHSGKPMSLDWYVIGWTGEGVGGYSSKYFFNYS